MFERRLVRDRLGLRVTAGCSPERFHDIQVNTASDVALIFEDGRGAATKSFALSGLLLDRSI
jgi:hypothetical protein